MVEFYLKLKLILRIISYLTYICWEIDNFVIKSDIFRRFFICKNILKKLSCYHDNYFRYFMFGKYNGFVSKARVSACMYFLVNIYKQGRRNWGGGGRRGSAPVALYQEGQGGKGALSI